ncbi:hypothetical protein [Treponema zioleckii]|uniref:hypothetical protein n=1 Tax=Treponema zioleckii TaxID=331680 RepID=UPI00168B6AB3|nr:hypothetical protein [Treponema zioleckii]
MNRIRLFFIPFFLIIIAFGILGFTAYQKKSRLVATELGSTSEEVRKTFGEPNLIVECGKVKVFSYKLLSRKKIIFSFLDDQLHKISEKKKLELNTVKTQEAKRPAIEILQNIDEIESYTPDKFIEVFGAPVDLKKKSGRGTCFIYQIEKKHFVAVQWDDGKIVDVYEITEASGKANK